MKGRSLPLPPLVARSALKSQITLRSVGNLAKLCYTLFDIGGRVCLLKTVSKGSAGKLMLDQGSDWMQESTVQNSTHASMPL